MFLLNGSAIKIISILKGNKVWECDKAHKFLGPPHDSCPGVHVLLCSLSQVQLRHLTGYMWFYIYMYNYYISYIILHLSYIIIIYYTHTIYCDYISYICVCCFSYVCDKIPSKSNLRKEGFFWLSLWRLAPSWRAECCQKQQEYEWGSWSSRSKER